MADGKGTQPAEVAAAFETAGFEWSHTGGGIFAWRKQVAVAGDPERVIEITVGGEDAKEFASLDDQGGADVVLWPSGEGFTLTFASARAFLALAGAITITGRI